MAHLAQKMAPGKILQRRGAYAAIADAALAHAATTAPPAFNGLFYATAATIIPVLFLALAAQSRA
jgi:hypothetical protein